MVSAKISNRVSPKTVFRYELSYVSELIKVCSPGGIPGGHIFIQESLEGSGGIDCIPVLVKQLTECPDCTVTNKPSIWIRVEKLKGHFELVASHGCFFKQPFEFLNLLLISTHYRSR